MMHVPENNPYASSTPVEPVEDPPLDPNPFSRCFLPFAFGSWLIISITILADPSAQSDIRFLKNRPTELVVLLFLVAPGVAALLSFVSSGWVQFRLRNDFRTDVRRRAAFFAGGLAPVVGGMLIWRIMFLTDTVGGSILGIIPIVILLVLLALGECVVLLSLFASRSESPSQPT